MGVVQMFGGGVPAMPKLEAPALPSFVVGGGGGGAAPKTEAPAAPSFTMRSLAFDADPPSAPPPSSLVQPPSGQGLASSSSMVPVPPYITYHRYQDIPESVYKFSDYLSPATPNGSRFTMPELLTPRHPIGESIPKRN